MPEFSDIALVTQVAVFHNKRAFDTLVRKYQSPVRRFFLNQTLGNEQLSDDLAQETFIKAYTNIAKFRGMSGFSTWLFRIAYNVFYDYCRKMKNEKSEMSNVDIQTCPESAFSSNHNSSFLISNSSLKMDLYNALSLLKDDERTCITLQLIDGYPIDKISEITGISENTVKSHLRRGKEKLSDYLKANGYDR